MPQKPVLITSLTEVYNLYNDNTQTTVSSYKQDPILLSSILYRITKDNGSYLSLMSDGDTLYKLMTEDDMILCNQIRLYYFGKLTWLSLKQHKLSNFRKDLHKLLTITNDNGTFEIPDNFVGMLYKLPYFYFYDQKLLDIFGGQYLSLSNNRKDNNFSLTFVDSFLTPKKKQNKKQLEYWFKDQYNDRVMLSLNEDEPLQLLFNHYLSTSNKIDIDGQYQHLKMDDMNYYGLVKWKVLV